MNRFTKIIKAIMVSIAVVCTMGITLQARGQNGNGSHNGHEYVDLGLPSGTLWATCNVGANAPEDYGNYYAWGEVVTKATYDWSTYKYSKGTDCNLIIKYCIESDKSYNGLADGLTVLEPSDDAATVNWGREWYTPTRDQWRELLGNTTTSWTTKNGVIGALFVASNGNSLFLPAAGCYAFFSHYDSEKSHFVHHAGDELHDVGSGGNYWSSTLSSRFPCDAWCFHFHSESIGYHEAGSRHRGYSVRPVCSKH